MSGVVIQVKRVRPGLQESLVEVETMAKDFCFFYMYAQLSTRVGVDAAAGSARRTFCRGRGEESDGSQG